MSYRSALALAALGVILFGFPGLMAADSADQLDMARRGDFGDWHPPAMSLLWWAVECIVAGPFGMLVLQVACFVAGAYLVLRSELAEKRAALAVLCVSWFPPVLTVMGVVWKDAQMSAYLLLGIGLLTQTRRRALYGAAVALVVASSMRHNAPAATLAPLLVLFARDEASWARRLVKSACAWLAISGLALGINHVAAARQEHPWILSIAVTDVVGMIRWAPPYSDRDLKHVLRDTPLTVQDNIQAFIVEHYNTRGWGAYFRDSPAIAAPNNDRERAAIKRAWQELVLAHPTAYLRHRLMVFRRVIHLGGARTVPPLMTDFAFEGDRNLYDRLSHDASPSGLQKLVFGVLRAVGATWYVAFIYLAVAIIVLPLARRIPMALALLLSGILYEGSLLFVAPSADYRYSHWLITTTLLAVILLVARRSARGRDAVVASSSEKKTSDAP